MIVYMEKQIEESFTRTWLVIGIGKYRNDSLYGGRIEESFTRTWLVIGIGKYRNDS